jgi:hypothetical protein
VWGTSPHGSLSGGVSSPRIVRQHPALLPWVCFSLVGHNLQACVQLASMLLLLGTHLGMSCVAAVSYTCMLLSVGSAVVVALPPAWCTAPVDVCWVVAYKNGVVQPLHLLGDLQGACLSPVAFVCHGSLVLLLSLCTCKASQ